MLNQAPAKPWTPVTDYSFEAREPIEAPNADLIVSTFHPTYAFDYGSGLGHLVRLLRERGVNATGYEPQRHGSWLSWDVRGYDLVICREVLEHVALRDYLTVLRRLCRVSDRWIYVTTRFHPDPDNMLSVATSDDLDPTHITMLNQDLLRALFVLHGFKRDREKEQAMDWMHKGRVLVYERCSTSS